MVDPLEKVQKMFDEQSLTSETFSCQRKGHKLEQTINNDIGEQYSLILFWLFFVAGNIMHFRQQYFEILDQFVTHIGNIVYFGHSHWKHCMSDQILKSFK